MGTGGNHWSACTAGHLEPTYFMYRRETAFPPPDSRGAQFCGLGLPGGHVLALCIPRAAGLRDDEGLTRAGNWVKEVGSYL